MPEMLAERSIWPVAGFTKTSPGVDEKVPATPPGSSVGNGSELF